MSELQRAVRTLSSRTRDRVGSAEHPDRRPVSISARLGRLQFHESGKFRVLQMADVQAGATVSKDTVELLSAAIDVSRPDLVVFTGNQIAGYDQAFDATFRKRRWSSGWSRGRSGRFSSSDGREAHLRDVVRDTIAQFVAPAVNAGVPWAVTYGNHDFQCGLDNAQLDEIYRGFPGCVNPASARSDGADWREDSVRCSAASGLPEQTVHPYAPGTFLLPVQDVLRSRTVLGLMLVDSGDYARSGGYGSPSTGAVAFIAGSRALIGAPSMLFQHMAIPQYYRLLKEVSATVDGAIEGYRAFAGRHYVLDTRRTLPGGYLGEGISCPDVDSGEFEGMTAGGACFAMACGHDHRNGFVGDVDGVVLMSTPTCGFDSYGPAPSQVAVRLVEFDIRHPHHPRTQLLGFEDLVGKASSTRKTYTYALNDVKASSGETIDLLHRPGRVARVLRALGIR